jgi:hypothetical protein
MPPAQPHPRRGNDVTGVAEQRMRAQRRTAEPGDEITSREGHELEPEPDNMPLRPALTRAGPLRQASRAGTSMMGWTPRLS